MVKQKINAKVATSDSIAEDAQRLIFGGKQMMDNETLKHRKIEQGSTIFQHIS